MINAIIESIGIALNGEFGDSVKAYPENQKQGFEAPCFFIQCINPSHTLFFGVMEHKFRYFRRNQFCINYFPKLGQLAREEINDVVERLEFALQFITCTGHLIQGTAMHYEIHDDILSFFVNYDMFIFGPEEEKYMMETLDLSSKEKKEA